MLAMQIPLTSNRHVKQTGGTVLFTRTWMRTRTLTLARTRTRTLTKPRICTITSTGKATITGTDTKTDSFTDSNTETSAYRDLDNASETNTAKDPARDMYNDMD